MAFIPYSRCLLKPIERLIELKEMVRILIVLKAGMLLNIYLFLDGSIEECTFRVFLKEIEIMVSSIGQ
jgi:hypothetical protein